MITIIKKKLPWQQRKTTTAKRGLTLQHMGIDLHNTHGLRQKKKRRKEKKKTDSEAVQRKYNIITISN
jgi:hypothetical protein